MIFALHQAARKTPRGHVSQADVAGKRTKKREAVPDKHRNSRNNEPIDQPCAQKLLNGHAAIDIYMTNAKRFELGHDIFRLSAQMLNHRARWRGRQPLGAEHEHAFIPIRPFVETQHRLVRFFPDDQRIHRGHEFVIAVRFAAARWQEVERAIRARNKAVEARPNEHRFIHGNLRPSLSDRGVRRRRCVQRLPSEPIVIVPVSQRLRKKLCRIMEAGASTLPPSEEGKSATYQGSKSQSRISAHMKTPIKTPAAAAPASTRSPDRLS